MKLKITVHGIAYEVDVEVLDPGEGFPQPTSALPSVAPGPHLGPDTGASSPGPRPLPSMSPRPVPAGEGGGVASPIAGVVVAVKCKPGDTVKEGDALLIIEAMKMNTTIAAPTSGTIKAVNVAAGDAIHEGQMLVDFA